MASKRDRREVIETWLALTRDKLGLEGKAQVVRNADGSYDGEIRMPLPRGTDDLSIIRRLTRYARPPPGYWFSVGTRYEPSTIDAKYRDTYLEWRGKVDVATFYFRSRYWKEQLASAYSNSKKMAAEWDRKAHEVVLRVNWNPADKKRSRRGQLGYTDDRYEKGDHSRASGKRKEPKK